MYTPYRGSLTPRYPMKRRLAFSTPRFPKRAKTTTGQVSRFNKRFLRGPSTKGSLYSQVKSLQRVVKDILPEVKNASISLNQTNLSTSGVVVHITAISQSTTATQRIGEDITVKKISVKGKLEQMLSTGTTSTPVYYRFFLVRDKQQINDTVPANTDIWSNSDPTLALPNISFEDRFSFLWVSPLICNNSVLTGNQMGVCNHQWSGNIKVGYNGVNTSDIQKNGIYFGILTSDTGSTCDFTGEARVSFVDA